MKTILLISLIVLVGFTGHGNAQQASEVWPTESWQQAAPEEHGIDSVKLAEALQAIRDNNLNVHSLLIIRNGSLVVDAYFYPYDGTTPHALASVTKSVITSLIGIAADQGKLSLDDPMLSFFPDRTIANRDALKESITVRHLASMSSGLDCTATHDELTLGEMQASPDYIQFTLDRKVSWEPGTHFVYCSPGMHLLSAILQHATGMTALDFAQQNLFDPLGIHDALWESDPQGYNHGWADLYLQPRDVAKIGYLWLKGGEWDGQQIVSREWVENSVKVQIETDESGDDYGYGWWIASDDLPSYSAIGRGGQRIVVVPMFNIVLVTTGGGFEMDEVEALLLPTIVDVNNPLPSNPEGVALLEQTLAGVILPPPPQPPAALPETAQAISGKTFVLEPNPGGIASLSWEFTDTSEASLTVSGADGSTAVLPVALDGVYRMLPGDHDLPQGMRGTWTDDNTFVLEEDSIANNAHTFFEMRFEGDQVSIRISQTDHEVVLQTEGTLHH